MTAAPKILIVDDSITARSFMRVKLSSEFDCDTAAGGKEALEKAQENQPAAILLDLEMPEMDGIDVLRALKNRPTTRHIPVIIVTQTTSAERMNLCHALGCAAFVLKPVQPDYLRAKLRRLLCTDVGPVGLAAVQGA